jgi:Fur family ferric uptake transcriptional regulator
VTLETALRRSDHRVTRPRQLVWDVLHDAERHLSAAEIVDAVHMLDPGVNSSSVYRTLSLFADLELVRESRHGEMSTWEPAHDDAVIHLVCDRCGATTHHAADVVDTLRLQLERAGGFEPRTIDVAVTGLCPTCAKRT